MPPDCTWRSLPPVATVISWNASKSKYVGEAPVGHVGDDQAVHVPDLVVAGRALASHGGLLAVLAARDIDAVDDHAGHRRHHAPGVARVGHHVELFVGHRGGGAALLGVDERRLAHDLDGLLERRDLQGHGDLDVLTGRDPDIARQLAETAERDRQGVVATVEVDETERTLRAARRAAGTGFASDRHVGAGQHRAGLVRHGAVDVAARNLLSEGRRGQREDRADRQDQELLHVLEPPEKAAPRFRQKNDRVRDLWLLLTSIGVPQ